MVCIRAKNSSRINAQTLTVVHLQWFVLTSKINSPFMVPTVQLRTILSYWVILNWFNEEDLFYLPELRLLMGTDTNFQLSWSRASAELTTWDQGHPTTWRGPANAGRALAGRAQDSLPHHM
jgi:hypothetical protein